MYEISLNRVHDRLRVREGNETFELRVDGDAMRMVAGLNEAQARLKTITTESTEDELRAIALHFAGVMFGEEQANELMEFYGGDAACVINICGRYFSDRLARLIERTQKRAARPRSRIWGWWRK